MTVVEVSATTHAHMLMVSVAYFGAFLNCTHFASYKAVWSAFYEPVKGTPQRY